VRISLITVSCAALVCACSSNGGGPPVGNGPDGGISDGGTSDGGTSDGGADGGGTEDGGIDAGSPGGSDWAQYRAGVRGTSANAGTFDAADAPNLRTIWTTELSSKGSVQSVTQPVIVSGTAYFTTAISANVFALDATTGAVRWSRSFNGDVTTTCGGMKRRGFWAAPAVVGGVLYLAAADGHAYALHPEDGTTIWATAIADPTAGGHGEFLQSSPAVSTVLGRLYLGVASSEGCDEVRGKIAMLDLATGTSVVKALVHEGQQGATIWSSISIDEAAHLVFASTGNRMGDISAEPLAQSIVSFDADTLDVVDHWQDPTPLADSDFGSSPTLFEDAKGTPLVAAANKDGMLFVLRRDRLSAGPVWSVRLAVIDPNNPNVGGSPSDGFGSIVSPTFAHGMLYAAGGRTPSGDPGSVVAFDPETGAVQWRHVTPGYVLAPMPAVGDLLIVESSAPNNSTSWLEVLDARSGALLRTFPGKIATFAAPAVAHGVILWSDATGFVTALAPPRYVP
jgi:outer membrane protein assembly factor BamB